MPVEWHYLDNGSKRGPITGEQLRSLVTQGVVAPGTPLRRVTGSTLSPWCRAAEVRDLFPTDRTSEMGGNICPDCGRLLVEGKCPVCIATHKTPSMSSAPPTLIAPGMVQPRAPSTIVGAIEAPPPLVSPESPAESYHALRQLMWRMRVTSVVGLAAAIGAGAALSFVLFNATDKGYILGPLVGATVAFLGGVGYLTASFLNELARVVLDMESTTRDAATRSRRRF